MSIQEDAYTILRTLEERGISGGEMISGKELHGLTGIDLKDFERAIEFLKTKSFIEPPGGIGINVDYWITSQGISYFQSEKEKRLPLSNDAEKILKYVYKRHQDDYEGTEKNEIKSTFMINEQDYQSVLYELKDFDFIILAKPPRSDPDGNIYYSRGYEIFPTREGRQAVRAKFRNPQAPIIYVSHERSGPTITANNVQYVVSAINSEINQQITETDPEQLRELINGILSKMVDLVTDELSPEHSNEYKRAAKELEKEIQKPDREEKNIKKWIGRLSLLDKISSTTKSFLSLAKEVYPFVVLLINVLNQLPN